MAAPKSSPVDADLVVVSVSEPIPMPSLTPPQHCFTLADAFHVLREALATHYVEDNMPAYLTCMEAQMIHANGGDVSTHPNGVQAWRMLLPLLEQALGATLRVT